MARAFEITRNDFSGGINTLDSDFLRKRNQAVAIINGYIGKRGKISVVPGYTQIGPNISGSTKVYVWQHRKLSDGTTKLLAASNGTVYVYNTGTQAWDTLVTGLNATAEVGFASLGEWTVFGNGLQATYRTDGVTTSTIASAPLANTFSVFGQRVYALNTRAASNRNRVFFSAVADPLTWTTDTDNFDIDGDAPILALARARSRLWAGAEVGIHTYDGSQRLPVSDYGAVGRQAMVGATNFAVGFDRQGLWGTPEGEPILLSDVIDDYISSIPEANLSTVVAGLHNKQIFVAVGTTSAYGDALALTNGIFVYDVLANAFVVLSDWKVASFARYLDNTGKYLIFGTTDGKVMQWPKGTDFAGANINFRLDTGWDFADTLNLKSGGSEVLFLLDRGGGVTVQYQLLTAKGPTELKPINQSFGDFVTRWIIPQGINWYAIRYVITEVTNKEGLSLTAYKMSGRTAGAY